MLCYTKIVPRSGTERGDKMLNKNLLKGAIARAGITQRQLAENIGMTPNTMSSRMQGVSHFDTEEIDKICNVLKISDNDEKANIFLS